MATTEARQAQRRIIRRPRLTRLLDSSSARIKLLVGPAGYGKTTLAREWLGESGRRGAWYRGGPASADVAALAAGVSIAASEIVPKAGTRMRERMSATGHPEEDVEILAELFAEDLRAWPDDAWLAIDDYHFAMPSAASEHFIAFVADRTAVQLLLTSRRRPGWASARRILYGEIQELTDRILAMDEAEAGAVVGQTIGALRPILRDAKGWPAVIGLLAARDEAGSRLELTTLDQFFQEELVSLLRPHDLEAICSLAVAPTLTNEVATLLLGSAGPSLIGKGADIGIFSVGSPGTYSVNPLLRRYLARLSSEVSATSDNVGAKLIAHYLGRREWDDAFEVAKSYDPHRNIPQVFITSLDILLKEGRLATVSRWLDESLRAQIRDPILDLAEAEVAFRSNDPRRSEQLAAQAAEQFAQPELAARALIRAGYAAVLASHEAEALAYFRAATKEFISPTDQLEAHLGEYYAASELGDPSASDVLASAFALGASAPDSQLRLETMRLTQANRIGGISEAVAESSSRAHLVSRARDPLVRTAFLHALATSFNLAARYEEALATAKQLLLDADTFRLDLPIPHAALDEAVAEIGLKRLPAALATLRRVDEAVRPRDPFLQLLAGLVRARVFLSQGHVRTALGILARLDARGTSPPAIAELFAWRGLLLAKSARFNDALQCIASARRGISTSIEARILITGTEAICAEPDTHERVKRLSELWSLVQATGNVDTFAAIYRAAPSLLPELAAAGENETPLRALLHRLGDVELARTAGLMIDGAIDSLTPRERQVANLLVEGLSNQEIASRLYISPATVKVHVRHIYEKLGVRNRSGAIVQLR